MDKSGRLPSFKPPRDLTLSRGGASRARRTYTPNIPPPRGRGGTQTGDSTAVTNSSNNSAGVVVAGSSRSGVQDHGTSRGNAPSTSQSERGRKKRGELLQSESIFGQGVGDPTLANRRLASVPSVRGGGSGSSRGGGGRKGYLGNSQLAEILKKREKEDNDDEEDWMGGNFVEYSDDDEEDAINDVSIPLSSYVHEERVRLRPGASQVDTTLGAKLEANSFANIFHSTDTNEDKLILIQLPSRLPVLDQAAAEASKSSTSNINPTLESLAETIESLPEGQIGKIQIMASGKSQFVLGDNVFDIQHGASISFLQELASIDLEEKQLVNLGPVTNKFVLTPNLDVLLKQPP